jgi:hypothetical protein
MSNEDSGNKGNIKVLTYFGEIFAVIRGFQPDRQRGFPIKKYLFYRIKYTKLLYLKGFMKNALLPILSLFVLFSCSVAHKLATNKTLRIIDRSVYSVDTISAPKYVLYYSFNSYRDDFFQSLKNSFTENNVTVIDTGMQIPDYTLIVTRLAYKEVIEIQTINDTASSDNGTSFPLRVCSITSESTLYNNKAEKMDDFSVQDYSSERVTNSRGLFDYIFHTNKEFHSYRQKSLASNIFEYIAKGCGKSTSKNVTNRISETEKKAKSF